MFRILLVAYLAVPFVAAATFTGSPIERVNSLACSCCADGGCSCDECECTVCGCNGAESLVSLSVAGAVVTEGQPSASCCAAGVCPSSLASTVLASTDAAVGETGCCAEKGMEQGGELMLAAANAKCGCEDCPAECKGCEKCTDGKCVCTDCSDE
jgi:hypothetical protein